MHLKLQHQIFRGNISHVDGIATVVVDQIAAIGTIPELIPPLVYIQNLHSSMHSKYPPSCFNLLVTPLKM